ncbi:MAG TPA: glycosyl hydrolase family 18 protein [Cytophagaceae bacterium]|nr:glycosyl hydrolase family 18 protein [Cytophagaceae bacterium]
MKNFFLLFTLYCLLANTLYAQKSPFPVIGYYASWSGEPEDLQYDKVTQVNFSFAKPASDGSILLDDTDKLTSLVELAHEQKVKVYLAIGGWDIGEGGGNDTPFETMAAKENSRKKFAASLLSLVKEYALDGIDIDWEYPDNKETFLALMKEIYPVLHAKNKGLSVAVAGEGVHADAVTTESFQYFDFLNIMAYDAGTPHSSFAYATKCLDYWSGKGCSKEKIILGLPFYGRDPFTDYKVIIADDPLASVKDHTENNVHYNGIPTIKQKTLLAKERAAGVMIWELTMDANNEYSLLKAIQDALSGK